MQKVIGKVRPKRWARRRGSVVIIVWASLAMMMGFCALAVDYGVLNVDANRLQRACDAAALAGASKLKLGGSGTVNGVALTGDAYDKAQAQIEAIRVAQENGATLNAADVTFPSSSASPKAWFDNARIRVESRYTRQLLFARFWNMNTANLGRAATAEVTPTRGMPGAVPIVITTPDYNAHLDGSLLTVQLERMQTGDGFDSAPTNAAKTPSRPYGEAIAIDTDPGNNGKSPSWWEDGVKDGIDNPVQLGVTYSSDTAINANLGNQSRRLEEALDEANDSRIARATALGWNPSTAAANSAAVYPNYPPSAGPRIFTIMVADETPSVSGNNFVTVLKFVVVYLESSDNSGKGSSETTRMTIRLMPNYKFSSEMSGLLLGTPSTSSTFEGPRIVRLIDDLG